MRELIDSADERPGEATRGLVDAVLDLTSELLQREFGVPTGLAHDLVRAVIRLVFGDQRADDLGFPATDLTALVALAAAQNRLYHPLLREVPAFHEQLVSNYHKQSAALLSGLHNTRYKAETTT